MAKPDTQLQTQILYKAVAEPTFAKFVSSLKNIDLFEGSPEILEVFSVIKEHYKQHNDPMVKSLLQHELGAKLDRKQVPEQNRDCLLYTSPSPRDMRRSRMPSSA